MDEGVEVRLFAQAREAVGRSRLRRTVPPDGIPLREFLRGLRTEFPRLGPLLRSCRFARNGAYVVDEAVRLGPGDDLAIHPPYSGG